MGGLLGFFSMITALITHVSYYAYALHLIGLLGLDGFDGFIVQAVNGAFNATSIFSGTRITYAHC